MNSFSVVVLEPGGGSAAGTGMVREPPKRASPPLFWSSMMNVEPGRTVPLDLKNPVGLRDTAVFGRARSSRAAVWATCILDLGMMLPGIGIQVTPPGAPEHVAKSS